MEVFYEKDFYGVKRYHFICRKLLGRFVTYFDHLESLASSLAQSAFLELTPFDWILGARELTKDEIDRRARQLFVPGLSARSLVVPTRKVE